MTELEHALIGLRQALEAPRRYGTWRRLVRNRMASVQAALARDWVRGGDAWLTAREATLQRERDVLGQRLATLGRSVLDAPDVAEMRVELGRLLADLEHHRQRINDLVYDSVGLELGGSD